MIDFDALLNGPILDTFGSAWEWRAAAGNAWLAMPAVFDRRHIEVEMDDAAPQSMRVVTLFVRMADLPCGPCGVTPAKGDLVRNPVQTWTIADVQPDPTGGAILVLGGRTTPSGP